MMLGSWMLPFFADLITRTDEARREFETNPVVLDAVAHGMPLARYRSLLLELYHVVWHFNPVCAAAASRVPDKLRQVRYFLYEHMHEESGHEQWVVNDLDAVGVSQATVLAHPPSLNTLALVGYNYWAADRRDPCSVLGMMYTLEVIASVYGGTFAEAIRGSLLLEGERGVSFISSHATREAIVESTLVNFHHITRVFEAV
jgi:hypothetical protein